MSLCLQEFSKLAEDANIYKLVGPVLLKQEKSEAVLAVNGRLQYIEKERYDSISAALVHKNDLTRWQQTCGEADRGNSGEK